MKILITGYRGFIGQNLVLALQNQHELTFVEKDDPIPDFRDHNWVIHLGANSSTTESNVESIMQQNYDYSCELLNRALAWGVNFQYASSASVYGGNREFSEDSPVNPQSPYAWTKYLFDRHVLNKLKTHNRSNEFVIQGFRYFNVYGRYEDHKGGQASPYYQFERQARETGRIKLFYGSHHYMRDFIPVERVVDLHQRFFAVKESGIWNFGTGQVTSFQDIASGIATKYGAELEFIDMPEKMRSQYQTYTCADVTKLKRTLGAAYSG